LFSGCVGNDLLEYRKEGSLFLADVTIEEISQVEEGLG